MGTTSEKLTYLNGTKQLLKDKINNLGGSIDDNTTFRQYANQLQNVYDNLPKTSYQEGTEINLGKTIKGKLDYENGVVGIGQSSQKILPNEYQEVEYIESSGTQYIDTGITPDNTLEYEIKFNTQSDFASSGTYGCIFGSRITSSSGEYQLTTWTTNVDVRKGVFGFGNSRYNGAMGNKGTDQISKLDNYVLTGASGTENITNSTFSNSYNIYLFALNQANTATQYSSTKIYYMKLWKNNVLVREMYPCYRVSDNVIGMYDIVNNVFYTNSGTGTFTKGANAPTPSQEIPIQCVTGNQSIVESNAQLIDFSTLGNSNTTSSFTNDVLEVSTNSGTYANAYKDITDLYKANTGKVLRFDFTSISYDVTPNVRIVGLRVTSGGTNSNVTLVDNNKAISTHTIPSDVSSITQVVLTIYANNTNTTVTNTLTINKPILHFGSNATPYQPYGVTITYPISLGSNKFYNIGDYADELLYDVDEDKVYKNSEIGKVVLNGTETYWQVTEYSGYYQFFSSSAVTKAVDNNTISVLSDNFLGAKFSDRASKKNIIYSGNNDGKLRVLPNDNTINTVELWATWLSTHNTEVYYVLATPTKTEITGTLKDQIKALYYSQSFTGTTILESNGDLPMIIKVRALKGE